MSLSIRKVAAAVHKDPSTVMRWKQSNPDLYRAAVMYAEYQAARRMAPWPDYAGADIFEGDVIRHPSGEQGEVVLLPDERRPEDAWRVRYGTEGLSRLVLQVGFKGQAVVEHQAHQPISTK